MMVCFIKGCEPLVTLKCYRFQDSNINYLIKIILNYLQRMTISVKIINDKYAMDNPCMNLWR